MSIKKVPVKTRLIKLFESLEHFPATAITRMKSKKIPDNSNERAKVALFVGYLFDRYERLNTPANRTQVRDFLADIGIIKPEHPKPTATRKKRH